MLILQNIALPKATSLQWINVFYHNWHLSQYFKHILIIIILITAIITYFQLSHSTIINTYFCFAQYHSFNFLKLELYVCACVCLCTHMCVCHYLQTGVYELKPISGYVTDVTDVYVRLVLVQTLSSTNNNLSFKHFISNNENSSTWIITTSNLGF